MKYKTILADPPWQETMSGKYKSSQHQAPRKLPYPTMTVEQICALPVADLADVGCHLWLWTTNRFIEAGFKVLRAWGFKYLAPIHWIKPSGFGNYFIHRTQTILFGYNEKCYFPQDRYLPNIIEEAAKKHSRKPEASYKMIEAVSPAPRLELFARPWQPPMFQKRPGWDVWGNEVHNDVLVGG